MTAKTSPPKGQPVVLNEASFRNVLGYTIIWWLLFGFFVGALIWRRPMVAQAPVWWLLVAGAIVMLPSGLLIYIFFYGGKSVTVLNDGLVIELWISRLLRLNRAQRVRWEEIRRVIYQAIPGARGSTVKLSLDTARSRDVFWSICFDDRELRRLREILREKLGNDKVELRGSGSGL